MLSVLLLGWPYASKFGQHSVQPKHQCLRLKLVGCLGLYHTD